MFAINLCGVFEMVVDRWRLTLWLMRYSSVIRHVPVQHTRLGRRRRWEEENRHVLKKVDLIEDPADAIEMEEVISKSNNWEKQYSNLDHRVGVDVAEVRLMYNRYFKENGYRNKDGHVHWEGSDIRHSFMGVQRCSTKLQLPVKKWYFGLTTAIIIPC
jgi:hypothetical protein